MEQAITTVKSGIEVWRSRDEVRELTERLKIMLPGGDRLSDKQKLALAQGSIAHGLDPFNGEIWMIPGVGLMIGVKGLRKKAREQVKGNFWIEFRELTDPDERVRWGIPSDALAFEARLFDSENVLIYSKMVETMIGAGIPWNDVKDMMGSKPYTSGVGVLRAGEKTKMERVQCAMKRAEADALKRRFDVPFGLSIVAGGDNDAEEPGYVGQWSDIVDGDIAKHDATQDEIDERLAMSASCVCGHTVEQHGLKLNCEADGCHCRKFDYARLARGKKALGRDSGEID